MFPWTISVICQLGGRSLGVARWTANCKISHCHRERFNWAGFAFSSHNLFFKRSIRGMSREERKGQHIDTEKNWLWQADIQTLTGGELQKEKTKERQTARGRTKPNWKTLSLSSLPPLPTPLPPSLLSASLILSFFLSMLSLLLWKRGDRHGQSLELRCW